MSAAAPPRPIDPFAGSIAGGYADDAVMVRRVPGLQSGDVFARTPHFVLGRREGRLLVVHDLPDALIDNDLAALLSGELFDPGWASGADTFERLMTGVILSCRPDPVDAWELFYRNTLRRIDELVSTPEPGLATGSYACLADFVPVYRRAEELIVTAHTRLLADLGSCFGFLPFRVAGHTAEVIASDLAIGTCRLMERMAAALSLPVRVIPCDAASVPLADRSADTVTALHLLEHVPAAHGDRIVREALRLARSRVIIAVPLESEPDPAFGHVRSVSLDDLAGCALRLAPDWRAQIFEDHGGWLILDR